MRSQNKTYVPHSQPTRGHHCLKALDLVTAAPEIDTPFLGINLLRSLFARRRKRRPSDKTLVKRAEVATGRLAARVTYHPDGSRTVEVGKIDNGHANGEDQEENPWHTI